MKISRSCSCLIVCLFVCSYYLHFYYLVMTCFKVCDLFVVID